MQEEGSETGVVSLEMMTSLTNIIVDGTTGLRAASRVSDERTRAPIIHLINFAVTDASRLVNYSRYHPRIGIFF